MDPCWLSHQCNHAALCPQTNRELHSIVPDTFVLEVETQHGQVPKVLDVLIRK